MIFDENIFESGVKRLENSFCGHNIGCTACEKGQRGNMVDLKATPHFPTDEDMLWVLETIAAMTDEEKAGQLFFNRSRAAKKLIFRI